MLELSLEKCISRKKEIMRSNIEEDNKPSQSPSNFKT